jgi:hypothetical protein
LNEIDGEAVVKNKVNEFDWVNGVLQDVVAFLCANDMKGSAEFVAAAAASVMLDLERRGCGGSGFAVREAPANVSNVVPFAVNLGSRT